MDPGSFQTRGRRLLAAMALPLALFVGFACYPNPDDLRTGSTSAAGGRGGISGVGGSTPGTGGVVTGTGGLGPGAGGAAPGAGGAKPGSGGSQPGTGGMLAGQGGAHAGNGGAPSGNGGEPAGSGGYAGAGTALNADADGWIARSTNAFGIQGAWYSISDVFANGAPAGGDCVTKGMHAVSECSMVSTPPVGGVFHPSADGKMCTSGTAAQVLLQPMTGDEDYDNMWGASIGFDFNGTGSLTFPFKYPFDAPAHGVRGIAFDIEWRVKPATGLRIVFRGQALDGSETSAYEYWGATSAYPPSPVVSGTNKVYWTDVTSATGEAFDPTKLGAMQFAVPTTTISSTVFNFCVSNVRVLTGTSATGS